MTSREDKTRICNQIRKLLFLNSIILVLSLMLIHADNFSVLSRLDNISVTSENITENIFEIKNEDYYRTKNMYNITFNYSISSYDEGDDEKKESIRISNFKSRKASGLGKYRFVESIPYRICTSLVIFSGEFGGAREQEKNSCFNYSIGEIKIVHRKNICDMRPEIIVEDYSAMMNPEKINFKVIPKRENIPGESNGTEDYLIEYWIEDIYGNVLKKKVNTSSISKKTFTIKNNLMMTLVIRARIINKSCMNRNNITDASIAMVINPEKTAKESIQLLDLKQVDSIVYAKIAFFRNTSDNKIDIWIENRKGKISNTYTIDILTMYADTILSIPIQVFNEENHKDDGDGSSSAGNDNAQLVIDGLGKRMTNLIELKTHRKEMKNNTKNNTTIMVGNNALKNSKDIKFETWKTIEKDFFTQFIKSNKTENVINSPELNRSSGRGTET